MANKHNSFKRILHRCLEEVKASCDVAKVISVKAAVVTFWAKIDIQIMNRNGFKEPESVKNRLMRKHQIMIDFLEDKFKDYWKNYKVQESMPDCDEKLRNKIWICWWQGIDNAPEIVKACVNTIKRNAGEYEVIVITDDNYKNYVQFPDWLEEKRKKGIISRTIYYMKMPLWSIKRPDYLHCSIASGYFANYSLGCDYKHRYVYAVVRDFLYNYWKHYDRLIDYLLTDYAIVLSQKHVKKVAEAFEQIKPNNKYCDELYKVLGQPYNEELWKKICKDTVLYKLTWKQSFAKEVDGKPTFYGMMIDGKLKRID